MTIDLEQVIDLPYKLYEVMLRASNGGGDYAEEIKELQARSDEIKATLPMKTARVCLNNLRSGAEFDYIHTRLVAAMRPTFVINNFELKGGSISMMMSFNLWYSQSDFYFLINRGGGLQLISVRVK